MWKRVESGRRAEQGMRRWEERVWRVLGVWSLRLADVGGGGERGGTLASWSAGEVGHSRAVDGSISAP